MSPTLIRRLNFFRELLFAVLMVLMATGVFAEWADYELFTALRIPVGKHHSHSPCRGVRGTVGVRAETLLPLCLSHGIALQALLTTAFLSVSGRIAIVRADFQTLQTA